MHSPPPPSTTTAAVSIIFLIFYHPLFATSTSPPPAHSCSPTTKSFDCPPFTSTPPFPFSPSPGCGHPSFQLNCSSSARATISINNLTFSLQHYDPNSTSLLLSPHPIPTTHNCSTPSSIPPHPINLSATPFQISTSSCSRLSLLKPCPPPTLPNCSHCSFQCKLIKNPLHLAESCSSSSSTQFQTSPQGCQSDILDFLDTFLKQGIEIEWDENDQNDSYFSNCKSCQYKHGVCGFNSTHPNKQFLCFRLSSQISPPWFRTQNPNRIAVLCIIFLITCFLLAVLTTTFLVRSKRKSISAHEDDPAILYLHRHRATNLLPPVFTFEELQISTNNFDPKRKIGDGGFGAVYLGQLYDKRIVAVKYLHKQIPTTTKSSSSKSFCNEILILSSINHPNLVKLHGYCSDPRGLILVYEYVPNGTLADHLHGTKSFHRKGKLTWSTRIEIALQVAVAMEYLHYLVVPPIVHRDITSNNIFIEVDMKVKIGDFGLSRLLVSSETTPNCDKSECVWTGPQGTPGYLDPDYWKSFRLTEKSDVYSFGVVLLELVTGMRAVDQRREKGEMALADMVVSRIHMGLLKEVVDPVLEEAMEGVAAVAELAFRCVAVDKDDRPDAREVVAELKSIWGRTRGGVGFVTRASSAGNVVVPEVGPVRLGLTF